MCMHTQLVPNGLFHELLHWQKKKKAASPKLLLFSTVYFSQQFKYMGKTHSSFSIQKEHLSTFSVQVGLQLLQAGC